MTVATTKKVLFFIAGSAPTAQEQAQIDWLNYKAVAKYQCLVRSILQDTTYGGDIEASDFVADSLNAGTNIPTAYVTASVPVLTTPVDAAEPDSLVIGPAALSFAHTSVSQMTAFKKNIDGTLTDVTAAAGMVWTSATGAHMTIGAGTGLVTGVGAGTSVITATYTYTGSKTIVATETVTCS